MKRIRLATGLLSGYYWATNLAGYSCIHSVYNAIKLTVRCLDDSKRNSN